MYNGTPQTGQMLAILFSLDLSNIEKSFKQLNFNVAKFETNFSLFVTFFIPSRLQISAPAPLGNT